MNEKQIAHLKAFISGEPVPNVSSIHYSSMFTAKCDVCGLFKLYPGFIGIGPEVQVIRKAAREDYAVVCDECLEELKKEHLRRTTYSKLFGEETVKSTENREVAASSPVSRNEK